MCSLQMKKNEELVNIVSEYTAQGVQFIGINSNDTEAYPDDAPEKMGPHALATGYTFPYLFDATQDVARRYDAACTPDFYVFDSALKLSYRGQMDNSRPKRNEVAPTGADLRAALDAAIQGIAAQTQQRPSGGCNIKWKN